MSNLSVSSLDCSLCPFRPKAAEKASSSLGCMSRSTASRSREVTAPSTQHLIDHIQNTVSIFGCPNTRKTSINWRKFSGGPPAWSGLKHLPCEERLREMGLLSLEKRRFQGDMTAAPATYQEGILHWGWSQVLHSGRMRDNGHKSK